MILLRLNNLHNIILTNDNRFVDITIELIRSPLINILTTADICGWNECTDNDWILASSKNKNAYFVLFWTS